MLQDLQDQVNREKGDKLRIPEVIWKGKAFITVNATVMESREKCQDAGGQDMDIFLATGPIDWTEVKFGMRYVELTYGATQLPLGIKKTARGWTSLSGQWFDSFSEGDDASDLDDWEKKYPLFQRDFTVKKPSDLDLEQEMLILCSRKAYFWETSETNHAFMKSKINEIVNLLASKEFLATKKLDEYESKPKSIEQPGRTLKFFTTRSFTKLFNSLDKLFTEHQWSTGVITREFMEKLQSNMKTIFKRGVKYFYGELTPEQEKLIENTYLIGKKIVGKTAKFIGSKALSKKHTFQGTLEVSVLDDIDNYGVYNILPLNVDGKVIKEKYLIKHGKEVFATKSIDQLGCKILPKNSTEDMIRNNLCKEIKLNPSSKQVHCAQEILQSIFPASCELVRYKIL